MLYPDASGEEAREGAVILTHVFKNALVPRP